MALILHEYFKNTAELGLWSLTEDEDFYLSKLKLSIIEAAELEKIKGQRRIQWLGVRYLLHHMSGRNERAVIIKDEYGKPTLENSRFSISLSHTDNIAAVYASPDIVGVDIQKIEDKIINISPKFINASESEYLNIQDPMIKENLHIIWGAKEAMYKAVNRKGGSFVENLFVAKFDYAEEGQTQGKLDMNGQVIEYDIFFRHLKNNMLVMAVKK